MIKEAIKTIRSKGDFVHKLYISGKVYYQVSNCSNPITINKTDLNVFKDLSSEFGFSYFKHGVWAQNHTEREIIAMAKNNSRPWNKTIKKERKRKNRSRTSVLINSENFEAFGPRSLAKDSNRWYYD